MTVQLHQASLADEEAVSAIGSALRWLATRTNGKPLRFLRHAIEDPTSGSAVALGILAKPSASLSAAAPETRALAVWGLIVEEVGKVGSGYDSRRRNALRAAFRLPPPPGSDTAWKATLEDRFKQLLALPGVFGDPPPTTTAPMHKAWKRAIDRLAFSVEQQLVLLELDGRGWQDRVAIGKTAAKEGSRVRSGGWLDRIPCRRPPSQGAQPVFMERMLVRVVMRRKTAVSRITERVVTACEDGVEGYDVHALTGWTGDLADIPVIAIWNCRLITVPGVCPGDPVLARLRFREKLRRGQWYGFVSEATDDRLDQAREWINVDVDHHGVAAGETDRNGEPVAGLTIQISFDEECLPEACWWYAEQTDHERLRRPPAGDPHLLAIEDGFVQHTFVEPCHPREEYGIVFRWPQL
ncbi:hypothetical protein QRX60_28005 [Amycolatopsis mongoliensis]|uniref:Uncharacterized protein n=1 Tax=Amycolatopsis mongoliensis TaxID=715475 RepID=A0A9Y2JHR9_9PSEU|nr:hypothetical protein [Amycolatopsis sp. 4-36]WIX97924.1 hypothetical protein QRX60_28005 [Amycolatopsis sp. 4-36]